jgi:hypothetical protein
MYFERKNFGDAFDNGGFQIDSQVALMPLPRLLGQEGAEFSSALVHDFRSEAQQPTSFEVPTSFICFLRWKKKFCRTKPRT